MSSVTDICNIALSHIGKPTINDLNEESEEARQCKLHYPLTKNALLQSYPWRFATKVQALAQITNDWTARWEFAYARPSDCLKIVRVIPEHDIDDEKTPTPYNVRANAIYCANSPGVLEYIYRIDDPTQFPPLFEEALTWALAVKIAMSLTTDQSVRKDAYQLAFSSASAAKTADANDEQTEWHY